MASLIETPPAPVFAQLARGPRALWISAALALGCPCLAGCEDRSDDLKMPSVDRAPASPSGAREIEREPDRDATHGRVDTFALSPGFAPDPAVEAGVTAGGAIDANVMDERCHGYVAATPDFVFTAERPFTELAIAVRSQADTTIVIALPDGDSRCTAEDALRADFTEGVHRIWIGTAAPGVTAPFQMSLSELSAPAGR